MNTLEERSPGAAPDPHEETGTLKKRDLAEKLMTELSIDAAQARLYVEGFFDVIGESLCEGRSVKLHGFGTFYALEKEARSARNVFTGETVHVGERRVVKFRPSTTLATSISERFITQEDLQRPTINARPSGAEPL